MYTVKAIKNFDDYYGKEVIPGNPHEFRKYGDTFECDKERLNFLLEHNAVELLEIKKKKKESKKK